MLLRHRRADQRGAVAQHGAPDGPVGPTAVGAPHDVESVRAQVPAAVALVQQWDGEPLQIDVVAAVDVLLAGTVGDDDRWHGYRVQGGDQFLQNVPRATVALQPEVRGEPAVRAPVRGAQPGRGAEDPESRGATGEGGEQGRGRTGLVGPPGDRPDFEFRVDGPGDRYGVAGGEQSVKEVPETECRVVVRGHEVSSSWWGGPGVRWARSVQWMRGLCRCAVRVAVAGAGSTGARSGAPCRRR